MLLNTLFWSINRICRTHHCSVCFLHLALCLLHIKIRTLSQTMWNKRLILVWEIFDKENTSAIFYRTYITKHNSWILHFSRTPWRLPWCLNLWLYLIGDFSCIAFWSSIHCSVQLMAEWFRKNSFWLFFAFCFTETATIWEGISYPQAIFTFYSFTLFWNICDSDENRIIPSRMLFYACSHRVVHCG